jgi:hypothetical protein
LPLHEKREITPATDVAPGAALTFEPEMRSPARTTRSTTLMFCPCRYFAILIPVMIGGIVTRRVDDASFVDTDDTYSVGSDIETIQKACSVGCLLNPYTRRMSS